MVFDEMTLPLSEGDSVSKLEQGVGRWSILRLTTQRGEVWEVDLHLDAVTWRQMIPSTSTTIAPARSEYLTDGERTALEALVDATNLFMKLPSQHPMHQQEFTLSMHQLQRLIMARPTSRQEGWTKS